MIVFLLMTLLLGFVIFAVGSTGLAYLSERRKVNIRRTPHVFGWVMLIVLGLFILIVSSMMLQMIELGCKLQGL